MARQGHPRCRHGENHEGSAHAGSRQDAFRRQAHDLRWLHAGGKPVRIVAADRYTLQQLTLQGRIRSSAKETVMAGNTLRLHRVLRAPPERVYRAFLDADAIAKWLPPNGFTCK